MKNIAKVTNPNPQGKATLPVLELLQNSATPRAMRVRHKAELMQSYLASTLVLSAHFNFEPKPGQAYYLYYHAHQWKLSLIEPEADRSGRLGYFFAECHMDSEWVWQVCFKEGRELPEELTQALLSFYKRVADFLKHHQSLDAQLPWYQAQLPFYRRVAARALAKSLRPHLTNQGLYLSVDKNKTSAEAIFTVNAADSAL